MKPTIPETGRVIRVDKDMAVILLHPGQSCKGCGAAEIGLCKSSGAVSTLIARNKVNAVPGDTVRITLDKATQTRGLLLAYVIPVVCFISGVILGHIAGRALAIPSLEVLTGFISLVGSAFYSLRKLKKLDSVSSMAIKEIVSDPVFLDCH
ncbi:MAG TPA: SoxR reducing system RseC family protein [Thermodesulfovibrionales bacterium]|nr:SoxR reducing system RseC family protein [Thermodesulfovibrionales bacterium]